MDCDFVGNCPNSIGSHLRGLPLYCCNSGSHDTMPHCNEVQPRFSNGNIGSVALLSHNTLK